MIKQDNQLTQDAIMADMFCAQVQTAVDQGDSVFNIDIHADLTGDEYADAVLSTIAWHSLQSML